MPERLATPLRLAHATADLLLANAPQSDDERQDVLDAEAMHSLGRTLAQHGDSRSLRVVELHALRATRGAAALRARVSAHSDGFDFASLAQTATMFRLVASSARAYRASATGPAHVPATRLLALASVTVANDVNRDSVDRVRAALLHTQHLLDAVRRDGKPGPAPSLEHC